MTKYQLLSALVSPATPYITLPDGTRGILSAVERESGSGSSFNVTLDVSGRIVTRYVRTID